MFIYILIALGFSLTIVVSSVNWQRSIQAVLIIVIFEGAIRKWILPQASDIIIFLKDIVLIGAYIRYYVLEKHASRNYPNFLALPILLITIWCTAEAFNPYLGSPISGFLGVKAYLLYLPMIWMIPELFHSEKEFLEFIRYYLLIIIPVGLLGVVQFFSPASSPINVYAGGNDAAALFGSQFQNVRITGTFSYLSGYTAYITAGFTLLIPLLIRRQTKVWLVVMMIEFSLLFITSFMTGARAIVLYIVFFSFGYILGMILRNNFTAFTQLFRFAPLAIIITIIISYTDMGIAVNAFWARATTSDSVIERFTKEFSDLSNMYSYGQFAGYGTGATHQAQVTLRQVLDLPSGNLSFFFSEGEMGRILLELGPVGLILWYGLRISLLAWSISVFFKLRRPLLYQYALAICLFNAINLMWPLVFNHVFATFYWFLNGVIFLLPKLDDLASLSQAEPQVSTYVEVSHFICPSYSKSQLS